MTLYLVAFVLTIGIELAIVAFARQFVPRLRETPTLSTCVCLNLLTHPLATLAHLGLPLPFLAVELAILVVESVGYRCVARAPAHWSITLALLTNLASMVVGVLAF